MHPGMALGRQEKVTVAGAVAGILDMCTVGGEASALGADSAKREVKRASEGWGVQPTLLSGVLPKADVSAAIELPAVASVYAGRLTGT